MENLEELFYGIVDKNKEKRVALEEKKIAEWNKDLEACNHIFETLSFLNKRGSILEKVCCTPYNKRESERGFTPYLRVASQLAIIKPIHDDPNYVFNIQIGEFRGNHSFESFIKKLATKFH
ncbi:MAG TPA: hypothetical protein VIV55_10280 [Flavobacterium sp.]